MRAFLISTLCVCFAYAKPQYNYPAPAPTYLTNGVTYDAPNIPSTFVTNQHRVTGGQTTSVAVNGIGPHITGSGGTLVQKHIYVHVAPPEPEEIRSQRPIVAGQSTKHYKIIFIKAPSYEQQQQQILQAQARNEEKTLVYVLVKKPDDVADISLPTVAPTAPSKPEVYFIRYKAKSEVTGTDSGIHTNVGGTQITGRSQLNLNTGTSSTSVSVGRPAPTYGPPGQSGPY